MISNATEAATIDVMLLGLSFVGIKQTISPPITFNPFTDWIREIASSIEKPLHPGSRFDTAGAIDGSKQSRSKVI